VAERHVPVSMGSSSSIDVELPSIRASDVRFPAGAILPAHTHERAIFAITVDGSLDCRMPGRILRCDAGSAWTEPAEERHANHVGDRGARVVALLVDPAADEVVAPCGALLDGVHQLQDARVTTLARQLLPELSIADGPSRLTIQAIALEILATALRCTADARHERSVPQWLRRARELIHDCSADTLDLVCISRQVGVEPARLARAFRQYFRVPPGTYQRALRLQRAGERLVTTDTPIAQVAHESGFCDQAHFTRHFRRHFGQTPGRYRRTRATTRPQES
jgi:AraC family transcriptional regulator